MEDLPYPPQQEIAQPVRPAPRPEFPRPVLTLAILIVNLALFLWMEFSGGSENTRVLQQFGALDRDLTWAGEYYRLLSAVFLHIGYVHLFSNMFALYLLGSVIESFYGRLRFLAIYLLAGVAGNVVSLFFISGVSAGASGAILGLAAAMLSRISAVKGRVPEASRRFFFFMVLFLIGLDILLGASMEHVNNGAHLGGFVAGWWFSFAIVLRHAAASWKRRLGRVLTATFVLAWGILTPLSLYQPWSSNYWIARGEALYRNEDVPGAVKAFERAAQMNPRRGLPGPWYTLLARHYYDGEDFEKALLYGRRAAARNPSVPYLHEWLERSYGRLGMEREADFERDLYLELLTLRVAQSPRNPGFLNDLAYSLAERNLRLDDALKLAAAANELTGYSNSFYLDTLAWTLYRQGKFDQAEQAMQQALKAKDDPVYRYHLGAIWIGQGKAEEGRAAIMKAIEEGMHWWDRRQAEEILAKSGSV